jgi:hypothetical protein
MMIAASGTQILSLTSHTTPVTGDFVEIARLRFDYSGGRGRLATIHALSIEGTSGGAQRVAVQLESHALVQPRVQEAVTQSDGTYAAAFDLSDSPLLIGSAVTVSAQISTPSESPTRVSHQLNLGAPLASRNLDLADLNIPLGCPAGFEMERNHFVAGYVDRLMPSRHFIPLVCSLTEITAADEHKVAKIMSRVGRLRPAARQWARNVTARATKIISDLTRSKKTTGVRVSASDVIEALKTAGRSVKLPRRIKIDLPAQIKGSSQSVEGDIEIVTLPPSETNHPAPPGGTSLMAMEEIAAGYYTPSGQPLGIPSDDVTRYLNLGWLGIIFYDRLRIRPAGTIAGDYIYSLPLAPGEEVTLTQRSETRRSKSFEEILDRTAEEELEFSSTWSTDLSQGTTDTESSSRGVNLGVNAGASGGGFIAGVNAGINTLGANS